MFKEEAYQEVLAALDRLATDHKTELTLSRDIFLGKKEKKER